MRTRRRPIMDTKLHNIRDVSRSLIGPPLFAVILSLFMSPGMAQAQKSKAPDCLDTAQTQSEMNDCAGRIANRADRELNETYQSILKKYTSNAVFIDRLRKAQRAWVALRDAQMEMKFPPGQGGGTVDPMCMSLYKAGLTNARNKELQEWLKGAEEGDVCSGSVVQQQKSKRHPHIGKSGSGNPEHLSCT